MKIKNNFRIHICFKIISFLKQNQYIHMKEIQTSLKQIGYKFTDQEIREYISFIRQNMVSKFQNPTGKIYLVANNKGYNLTDKKPYQQTYLTTLTQRYKSLKAQIKELKKAIKNNERH